MNDADLMLVLLAVTLVLLVTQWVRIEVVALSLVAVLALTGVLSTEDALSGFSSQATITVAAMLVLSAGLERAGAVDLVAGRLAALGGGGERRLLLALMLPTAVFSAFMNNTPVVALMVPVAITLARRFEVSPSKLLLPVSYASILAGTCTLIGTSTNILVDGLARDGGFEGFSMFEFSKMGVLYLVVGGAYVVLAGPRFLPRRSALSEVISPAAEGRFVTEIAIPRGSPLAGRPLAELVEGAEVVKVLELVRGDDPTVRPFSGFVLAEEDVLIVEASARAIHALLGRQGVAAGTAVADAERVVVSRTDLRLAEAVVTPNSRFDGERIQDLGLSRVHGVQVLAVRRLGRHHRSAIRAWRLRSGDVLLVLGQLASLEALQEQGDVFLVQGVEESVTFPRKAPLAAAIMLAVVLLASLGVAPIVHLALIGAAAMILTRCLDVHDATRSLEPSVLMLLAGTIPLGLAMERTGLAADMAASVVDLAGPHGPIVLVSAFYLLTSLLTEFLSNNAAAVLLTPIGLGIATRTGIDPKPLLVAIAFGASASFATPIGYQTNALVMGPGGYRFSDYVRFGLPLNLLMWISATILIPAFWPP
ncbi:MAG: SLC13 family permease [Planctomycetes bacterium]|nr:SLC13 family permease [Planctomycetota bacterium]